MKKLLCVLLSALMIISTLITTSATEISESVSATPDEVETQPTEGYCDGFYYTVLEDGTAEITNYDGEEADLIIPEEVNGIAVTKIEALWDYPFYETNIRHIFIGKNITYINTENGNLNCLGELQAFSVDLNNEYYCSIYGVLFNKDKSILLSYPCAKEGEIYNIPESVKEIGAHCFSSNRNLTDLDIPDNITNLGWNSFYNCFSLESVTLGNGIINLDRDVFEYCRNLKTISFGNNLISFSFNDIWGTSVKDIFLPDSVKNICDVSSTYNIIENIFVDNANESYFDLNGVLYSKENNKMLYYPKYNKTEVHIVPEGIIELSPISNNYLKELSISSTVNKINTISSDVLESIYVNKNNDTYADFNSALYSKDKSVLLIYPNRNNLEILDIPEGVVKTCDINNTTLKTLNIPSTVTELGKITCDNLENINVNEQNKNYCSIDGVLYDKDVTELMHFPLCSKLEELRLPDSVKCVNSTFETKYLKNIILNKNCTQFNGAFFEGIYGESSLENIFVDEENQKYYSKNGVLISRENNQDYIALYPPKNKNKTFEIPERTQIIYFRGKNIEYLENVYIPASAEEMYWQSFAYCPNLKNIFVDKDNKSFSDIDGILYNKNQTTILKYPRGRKEKSLTLPETIETISNSAFYYCDNLTSIVFPDSLTDFDSIFWFCDNLKTFSFSKQIQHINKTIGYKCEGGMGHGGASDEKMDGVTIRGYSGTVAETYAKENGFTFISLGNVENTLGDVNEDGVISILDATEIQKYLASLSKLNENQIILADFNKDGIISIIDATEIQKYIAGLV